MKWPLYSMHIGLLCTPVYAGQSSIPGNCVHSMPLGGAGVQRLAYMWMAVHHAATFASATIAAATAIAQSARVMKEKSGYRQEIRNFYLLPIFMWCSLCLIFSIRFACIKIKKCIIFSFRQHGVCSILLAGIISGWALKRA